MTLPPPQAAPQPVPAPARTNVMAILALVMAFVMPVAGIVLGVLAKREIARTGEEGEGLATAGFVIGIISTAFIALFVIVWLGMMISMFAIFPWTLMGR